MTTSVPLRQRTTETRNPKFESRTHSGAESRISSFDFRFSNFQFPLVCPPCAKEVAQQPSALFFQDTPGNFQAVIELRVVEHLQSAAARSGLRVVGAVNEARYTGVNRRAGAHRARLYCNIQHTAVQTVVANPARGS